MVVLTNREVASAFEGISLVGTDVLHHSCYGAGDIGSSSTSSNVSSNHQRKPRGCNYTNCTPIVDDSAPCQQQQIDIEIPVIDLSCTSSEKEIASMVRACEELGFFKVINHGIPREVISKLEEEAKAFFSQPQEDKDKSGPPNPYGYGNKRIGPNGDVGWLEYLLMQVKADGSPASGSGSTFSSASAAAAVGDYIKAVRKLACQLLEMIAQGLGLLTVDSLSKLLNDDASDSFFRINHYPPYEDYNSPQPTLLHNKHRMQQRQGSTANTDKPRLPVTGFGAHTDPQIISVLRSNSTSGLEICLRDGTWLPVTSDETSFFINVGDSLQVLTNGRFRSVRHKVITSTVKSRLSMIFFGAPAGSQRITAMPELLAPGEESRYKEFTWSEYKASAYKTRLHDNRIAMFQK